MPSHSRAERRHDIDWLRIGVVALLFVFHAARVFDPTEPFYVWSDERSLTLSYAVIGLFNQWAMPLLFLVSGSATWYALGTRSGRAYLGERARRLLVPFLFGTVVIVPPQAYLARLDHAPPAGSYLSFLGGYFTDWSDLSGYYGTFTPAHLWFIVFLLAYSVISLPLLLHLRSARGQAVLGGVSRVTANPLGLLSVGLVFAVAAALPDIAGKNPFLYLAFFLVGFWVVADPRPQRAITSLAPIALLLAVVTYAVIVWVNVNDLVFAPLSAPDVLLHLVRHFGTWFWLIAILGFGRRYLSFGHPLLARLSEASYPVYVLHQTVIVLIAFPVVRLALPPGAQYSLIVIVSLVVMWLAFVLLVRPWNPLRALMGLKRLPDNQGLPLAPSRNSTAR